MKRSLSVLFVFFISISLFSQETEKPEDISSYYNPNVYLGLSTGINNMNGLVGVHLDIPISDNILLEAGAGLGGWGYKYTANVQYYPNEFFNWFYKAGYSYSTGLSGLELEMETSSGDMQNITFDYLPVNNINLSVGRAWKIGRVKNRFYVEGGYSVRLNPDDAYTVLTPGMQLSSTSKQVMTITQPGGLILAMGFAFGL